MRPLASLAGLAWSLRMLAKLALQALRVEDTMLSWLATFLGTLLGVWWGFRWGHSFERGGGAGHQSSRRRVLTSSY